jgi:hypothetical protein
MFNKPASKAFAGSAPAIETSQGAKRGGAEPGRRNDLAVEEYE